MFRAISAWTTGDKYTYGSVIVNNKVISRQQSGLRLFLKFGGDMKLIVAVDENWGIGFQGNLLVQIPGDMRFFREKTIGKTIILGRKTLESFPNGKPLPDRRNIVLSRKTGFEVRGATVAKTIEEALAQVKDLPSDEVCLVGGGDLYKQMLKFCDTAYVTKVHYTYQADTHFPNLDQLEDWELVNESEEFTYYNLTYVICEYRLQSI